MPPRLPIDDALPALLDALSRHASAVVVAPPGAGKTTRVPLALLDQPWCAGQRLLLLEPRRLAARAAARRMAATLEEEVGATVGYRVRLENKVSAKTRIEVVTEGVFTRMILDDPSLEGVGAVLFDEFHERSLDADLGLALALETQGALREDLRLIVMSATLDGAAIARHLKGAPVIESQGRAYEVDTRYLGRDPRQRIEDAMVAAIRQALDTEPGSILAFLPGQGEIQRVAERLQERLPDSVDVAPLYGTLSPQEQDRAIQPARPGRRKIVLATSIAQTSLTIEGIRVVVDSGLARVPVFEPSVGLTRLETVRASRAAVDQRRGRAGRTEPGVCYRLWDEAATLALPAQDRPEILEADLAPLVLDLAAWGVTDPAPLAFLDAPPAAAWSEAVRLLQALDALDASGLITAEGRALQSLPLHPRLAHMVRQAARFDATGLASDLAVLIQERGLGGTGVDLADRLRRFSTDRSKRADDARALSARYRRLVGGGATGRPVNFEGDTVGALLALAYPDRIAQARGATGHVRLANGRGAMLDASDALAREPFLVVADLQGAASGARIQSAAAIQKTTLETVFADRITTETEARFDEGSGAVRARRVRRLDRLVLSEEVIAKPDAGLVKLALIDAVTRRGAAALPWSKAQLALRERATYARRFDPEITADVSDEALTATVATWLGPFLDGKSALSHITAEDLGQALDLIVPYGARRALDAFAPSHFTAPTGSTIEIDYAAEAGPTIAIRVQELFGLAKHPTIADGATPLVVELLSPAHRPIQVTRDLVGFWRGSWTDVKKDMRGRYPKHVWPDDPATAAPTTRAKPRGT
jgi:ATP-dependent helicase HrpB